MNPLFQSLHCNQIENHTKTLLTSSRNFLVSTPIGPSPQTYGFSVELSDHVFATPLLTKCCTPCQSVSCIECGASIECAHRARSHLQNARTNNSFSLLRCDICRLMSSHRPARLNTRCKWCSADRRNCDRAADQSSVRPTSVCEREAVRQQRWWRLQLHLRQSRLLSVQNNGSHTQRRMEKCANNPSSLRDSVQILCHCMTCDNEV